MREILFLAHRIPFPPDRGDRIRSWHLLRHLARLGRVHLACLVDDQSDLRHLDTMRNELGDSLGEICAAPQKASRLGAGARAIAEGRPVSLTLFDSQELREFVRGLVERRNIDLVFAFSGQMAQFVPAKIRSRFVMDFGDVDSEKFAQYGREASGPMRWVHRREANLLGAFEAQVAKRADLVTFVSRAEAHLFRSRTGLSNVQALSNGIDLAFFDPEGEFPPLPADARFSGPMMLFTGQMDYPPNVDAVCWFAKQVLPLLPGTHFVIAGRAPTPEVWRLAGPDVLVTGAVADMRPWLAAAHLVVAPLRIARGIQNKVLEAMAMARPVVASPAAFEGIDAEPGRDLVIADGAEAMAGSIRRLLADPDLALRIGRSGHLRVREDYGWESRLAALGEMAFPGARKAAA